MERVVISFLLLLLAVFTSTRSEAKQLRGAIEHDMARMKLTAGVSSISSLALALAVIPEEHVQVALPIVFRSLHTTSSSSSSSI